MDPILMVLKLAFPGLPVDTVLMGARAVQVAMQAFGGDVVRTEAEIAVIFAELGEGKVPSIIEKVLS